MTAARGLTNIEFDVMKVMWVRGESSVSDVVGNLAQPLPYTTVMSALNRLYRKGLVMRRSLKRAFLYTPSLSRREWEQQRVHDFVDELVAVDKPPGGLAVSCLVEALGEHDATLLDDLLERIESKREVQDKGEEV